MYDEEMGGRTVIRDGVRAVVSGEVTGKQLFSLVVGAGIIGLATAAMAQPSAPPTQSPVEDAPPSEPGGPAPPASSTSPAPPKPAATADGTSSQTAPSPSPAETDEPPGARSTSELEAADPDAPAAATGSGELPAEATEDQLLDALDEDDWDAYAALKTDDWLRLYGFMDVGLKKTFPSEDPFFNALVERRLTFVLGNINLYIDAQPDADWRALTEVRFTTYPHGEVTVDPAARLVQTDTRVYDSASPSGRNRVVWGGVVLERSQIERTITNLFNLRVGYFLTPYGIWNVDHGIPTLIANILPQFQVGEAIPQRQVGLEAYGSEFLGEWNAGYSAYVSNGRSPYLVDETDGKAVGGRLVLSKEGATRWAFGASGYYGDASGSSEALDFSGEQPEVIETPIYEYDEWAAGLDLSMDWDDLRVRMEGLIHRVKYADGLHEPRLYGAPGTFRPNRYEYFWYSIVAYRIGMFEPYTYTELFYTTPRDGPADLVYLPSLGANINFSPYTQLKIQYMAPKFYDLEGETEQPSRNFRVVDARLVMSF